MKSNDFLKEDIVSDAQDMHLDHEVQMARQECYHAAEDAITLHKLLRHMSEQQGLEGWVSAKITLAADYLKTVREHLEYQLMSAASAAPEEQDTMQVVTVAENVITAEDLAPVDEGQQWPDNATSLAKRSTVATSLKGAPEKAGRTSGMTVATRVDPTITSTKVQRKTDERPVPSFLQKGVAEGGPYDLPGIDYPRPGDTPAKPRHRGQQSPGVNPDDEAYFREIWRKKREAAKKAEQDKEQGISEMSAGSVAGVVNPTPKNKAKVGSLFGGTYKQKKAAK